MLRPLADEEMETWAGDTPVVWRELDRDLVRHLVQVEQIRLAELRRLVRHWATFSQEMGLVDFLSTMGILSPQCQATLQLKRRGLLGAGHSRSIFQRNGRELLLGLLTGEAGTAPPASTPPTTTAVRRLGDSGSHEVRTSRSPSTPPGRFAGQKPVAQERPDVPALPVKMPSGAVAMPGMAELPRVGQTLGKCLLTRQMARGGSCLVFEATHQSLQVQVAVKVFLPVSRQHDAGMREQFRFEAQSLARLDHANIIRILDFEDDVYPYLVLEFINGFTLEQLIANCGRLAPQQASQVVYKVASALAYAHSLEFIHRDIKPANIMIDMNGKVKLADLGIARLRGSMAGDIAWEATHKGLLCGTPAYVSPEQAFTPDQADARSDIYSLGVSLYQAVTGELPFVASTARGMVALHATGKVKPPHLLRQEIPEELSEIILKMMARDVSARYATMALVAADLKEFLHDFNSAQQSLSGSTTLTPTMTVSIRRSFSQFFGKQRRPASPPG